jgi:hypothetical protein
MDQPPPDGVDWQEELLANVENSLLGFFALHFGQLISSSLSLMLRRKENFSPHLLHSYSYMGILPSFYF